MSNLTLKIPDEELQLARIRALKEGTSVNEIVRRYLKEYGRREERMLAAMDRVLEAAASYHGKIKGGRLNRAEIYDRTAKRGE